MVWEKPSFIEHEVKFSLFKGMSAIEEPLIATKEYSTHIASI